MQTLVPWRPSTVSTAPWTSLLPFCGTHTKGSVSMGCTPHTAQNVDWRAGSLAVLGRSFGVVLGGKGSGDLRPTSSWRCGGRQRRAGGPTGT